jgi:bifunctional DNA-binding transcriptional regulator/antitoxin component of YhaV-PrlF toxin-antitoxin module
LNSARIGKRGTIVVSAELRHRFGLEEGSYVTAEPRDEGFLLRPAMLVPIEKYTPERKAEFLLTNATNRADYNRARREVKKLGLDPDSVPHRRPK